MPTTIAWSASNPSAVAVDDTSVYFTSWGSIWKIAFAGDQPTRIATGQGEPNAIAVDAKDRVYAATSPDGKVYRLSGSGKPEVGGEYATESLAVVRAGIVSAREGRKVEVAEILRSD